jgi:hypothetical protein
MRELKNIASSSLRMNTLCESSQIDVQNAFFLFLNWVPFMVFFLKLFLFSLHSPLTLYNTHFDTIISHFNRYQTVFFFKKMKNIFLYLLWMHENNCLSPNLKEIISKTWLLLCYLSNRLIPFSNQWILNFKFLNLFKISLKNRFNMR